MKPATLKSLASSGGVIFKRHDNNAVEIAMVSIRGGNIWCLPKGSIDKGEVPEKTALREVAEETGLKGRIVDKLGEITYWFSIKKENAKCKKTVHFYLLEYESGDTSGHDWEVDSASWIPIDEALQKARYKGEKEMITLAREKLFNGHS
jgi:8-oxo-dGTP pyrophosphatase MutT (NUDIX family)